MQFKQESDWQKWFTTIVGTRGDDFDPFTHSYACIIFSYVLISNRRNKEINSKENEWSEWKTLKNCPKSFTAFYSKIHNYYCSNIIFVLIVKTLTIYKRRRKKRVCGSTWPVLISNLTFPPRPPSTFPFYLSFSLCIFSR